MLSWRRRAVEVFGGFGYRAMTSKRRECMRRQASAVWPSLKDGRRATPMWFSVKHSQVGKTEPPTHWQTHTRGRGPPIQIATGEAAMARMHTLLLKVAGLLLAL